MPLRYSFVSMMLSVLIVTCYSCAILRYVSANATSVLTVPILPSASVPITQIARGITPFGFWTR
jgi:hypothetical protein